MYLFQFIIKVSDDEVFYYLLLLLDPELLVCISIDRDIGLKSRVFTNDRGDRSSILGRVIPKT